MTTGDPEREPSTSTPGNCVTPPDYDNSMGLDAASVHALPGRQGSFRRLAAVIDDATAPQQPPATNWPAVLTAVISGSERRVERDGDEVARLDGVPISYDRQHDSISVGVSIGPVHSRRCLTVDQLDDALEQHEPGSLRSLAERLESVTKRSMVLRMIKRIVGYSAAVAVLVVFARFTIRQFEPVIHFVVTRDLAASSETLTMFSSLLGFVAVGLLVVGAVVAAALFALGVVAAPFVAVSNYRDRFVYAARLRRYADDVETRSAHGAPVDGLGTSTTQIGASLKRPQC